MPAWRGEGVEGVKGGKGGGEIHLHVYLDVAPSPLRRHPPYFELLR